MSEYDHLIGLKRIPGLWDNFAAAAHTLAEPANVAMRLTTRRWYADKHGGDQDLLELVELLENPDAALTAAMIRAVDDAIAAVAAPRVNSGEVLVLHHADLPQITALARTPLPILLPTEGALKYLAVQRLRDLLPWLLVATDQSDQVLAFNAALLMARRVMSLDDSAAGQERRFEHLTGSPEFLEGVIPQAWRTDQGRLQVVLAAVGVAGEAALPLFRSALMPGSEARDEMVRLLELGPQVPPELAARFARMVIDEGEGLQQACWHDSRVLAVPDETGD